jgi:tRNA threonylcarbamoyl adenosine modification protein (Sua5/YciO/YrdC/YwlC family)
MLLKIYPENPNPKAIEEAVAVLRSGGVVIYPTDTVYAFGCDIFQARAVEKICKFRGLDPAKAHLSIICSDLSHLSEFAKVDNNTFKLMKRLLPGPFTFILKRSNRLPKLFKERSEVGIRIPANTIAIELVKALENPILSASLRDDDDELLEYVTDPELMSEKYDNEVDLVIDGGYGDIIPSTVIDCTDEEPVIVRQGKGKTNL